MKRGKPDPAEFAKALIEEIYGPMPPKAGSSQDTWHSRLGLVATALTRYRDVLRKQKTIAQRESRLRRGLGPKSSVANRVAPFPQPWGRDGRMNE